MEIRISYILRKQSSGKKNPRWILEIFNKGLQKYYTAEYERRANPFFT